MTLSGMGLPERMGESEWGNEMRCVMADETDGVIPLTGGSASGPVVPGYYGRAPVPAGFVFILSGPPNRIKLVAPSGKTLAMVYEEDDPDLHEELLRALGFTPTAFFTAGRFTTEDAAPGDGIKPKV